MSYNWEAASMIMRLAHEDGKSATYADALEFAECNCPEYWGMEKIKAYADEIFTYMRMIALTER